MAQKYHYETLDVSDDYFIKKNEKPSKCKQLEALEDQGWEIFSLNKYHASTDWQVVVRKPR